MGSGDFVGSAVDFTTLSFISFMIRPPSYDLPRIKKLQIRLRSRHS